MAFSFTLPLRIAQGLITLIELGLMAYVVADWSGWGPYGGSWSPGEANYLLFCSIWTILALAYLIITPGRFPDAAHKFGILAVEVLTMIFWFAGWIAMAALLGDWGCNQNWGVCRASTAATVFAAFEWLLFVATMIMASLHCWRTRNRRDNGKADRAMEVHTSSNV